VLFQFGKIESVVALRTKVRMSPVILTDISSRTTVSRNRDLLLYIREAGDGGPPCHVELERLPITGYFPR